MLEIGRSANAAAIKLSNVDTAAKNSALLKIADALKDRAGEIKEKNSVDLDAADKKGITGAMLDRLKLDDKRIDGMAEGVREVAVLPDPVGEIVKMWKRPNGLMVGKMRIPLGVIGIIYESRPNVTVDAAVLTLKSSNAVILRGGSEAINSNSVLGNIMREVMEAEGLPVDAVQVVATTDRAAIDELLKLDEHIDLIIPRGGEALIRLVAEKSRIPVLKHYKGVCHIYVDGDADIEQATNIAFNAKVQRPGVCNAMETLLVDKAIAGKYLPVIGKKLLDAGVEIRGCDETCKIIDAAKPATEDDWPEEYLDLILAVRVVDGMDMAIEHIEKYGSDHTESILTTNYSKVQEFIRRVNSSTVMANASTRFSDGFELGLGAEIGISTTKLHAYGPMGLEELTTTKFIVYGDGQIRE